MPTLSISLPDSLKAFIEDRVAKDGYGTVSEYLRELIRADQKRNAQLHLEALLLEGLKSESSEMTSADWADIREALRRRRKAVPRRKR